MSGFGPKNYQTAVLQSVEKYFDACHRLGKPSLAFTDVTEELWGRGLAYARIEGFAPDMPYFCLRVPTGGGKTYLAAKSVQKVNRHLLKSEHGVVLWLVPSKAIREQTLKLLRDLHSPLRAALAEAGAVTVIDLAEARSLSRATVETSTVVVVATVQAFRREDTEGLKVYENNGALMPHFEGLSDVQRGGLLRDEVGVVPYSLANVLRLRRPFLIVDEAHNSRTPLSFSTFASFNPSGILELTATPDTETTPSNVLHSVSAMELKGEHMIKLPILLETQVDWQKCLAYAIDRRDALQGAAEAEQRAGAPYLRPLVLIQTQPRSKDKDTLHVERVRIELIDNHGVSAEQIVIATGEERGLEAIDKAYPAGIADPACPVRYVLTQQALAEGWDCPSAYVLVSLAGTQAETAVEQLLGRVLRQPGAALRGSAVLNQSYAFVMSNDFTAAASQLRDRLVAGAGFEQRDAADFVQAVTPENRRLDLGTRPGRIVVTPVVVPLAKAPPLKTLPKTVRDKLAWDKAAGELTIHAALSEAETAQLAAVVADKAAQAAILVAGEKSRTEAVTLQLTPAERGERLSIPALALCTQGVLQLFDEIEALDFAFELSPYDAAPIDEELRVLGLADRVEAGGTIDINAEGRVQVGFIADLERDFGMAYSPENWDEVRLAAWLCRNIPSAGLAHSQRWPFVLRWLKTLVERPNAGLAFANRHKFLIRTLLEARIGELRHQAAKVAFQQTLFGPNAREHVQVSDAFAVDFDPTAYAPHREYDGRYGVYDFRGHYYDRMGDFDSEPEFRLACWLDQQVEKKRIDFWVRNLVNKPGCSFFLQKARGKFWPDFLCRLLGGKVLVVEYKGERGWTDAQDDRDIGQLWATLSDGRCRFVMVGDEDRSPIDALLGS